MAAEPKYVIEARAKVARLYHNGKTPTQSEEAVARAGYVAAKIDSEIRKTIQKSAKGARLDDNHVAHLTGLLLSNAGVKADAIAGIEALVRLAVLEAQQGGAK
jgi:hypothetical protein